MRGNEFDFQNREPASQTQSTRAKLLILAMMILMPVLSIAALFLIPIYGCLIEGRLSPKMVVVMSVSWVFFAVSWIPYVNLGMYVHVKSAEGYHEASISNATDTRDMINGGAPLASYVIFCVWGIYIAFRHFAISDSYEAEEDRTDIQPLSNMTLEPAANYFVEGEGNAKVQKSITNALELYQHLKQEPKYGQIAAVAAIVLAAGTAAAARLIPRFTSKTHQWTPDFKEAEYLFILSTMYFSCMFLVFYMTLSFVVVIYLHQMMFIRRVTYCADEKVFVKREMEIATIHIPTPSHLRAWDQVRRVALLEMTNPKSLLNSFFTPTLVLCVTATVAISGYFVVQVMFKGTSIGQLAIVLMALMMIFLGFTIIVIVIAKVSQRHMKRHTTIVARNAFDIARELDRMTTNLSEGLRLDAHQSRSAKAVLRQALTDLKFTEDDDLDSDVFGRAQIERLEEILHSLSSLCTFMVANQPRPLILGIQLRYVRFVVVYVFLLGAILIFFALMVAIKKKCE